MLIVRKDDALVIEAKVAPHDIDRVQVGQHGFVRFSAFNRRTTPELQEQQTNQAYYVVRLALSDAELKRLGGLKLVPGMPADVYIRTTERTALSYLLKPLHDRISKAFIER